MPGTSDVHIKVSDLAIGYGGRPLLEHLEFEIHRGEIFAILGGSGSGKSTLLRHLIGLAQPIAGRVQIDGAPPALGAKAPDAGVLFQSGALLGSLTLAENVALPLVTWTDLPEAEVDAVVRSKLRLVGLGGSENLLPAELSGGMKKRAAIARAMALDPAILFLDEPSAGLDPITSAELDQLLIRLARNLSITFVVVTHELPSIYTIADRVIMLDGRVKKIVATGAPAELRDHSENEWVRQFFRREASSAAEPAAAREP
jgi:phospholipid/cholesterol/gamma-HCH transport system ATP-binding protein